MEKKSILVLEESSMSALLQIIFCVATLAFFLSASKAQAISYSSTLKFKTTSIRVEAKHFQDIPKFAHHSPAPQTADQNSTNSSPLKSLPTSLQQEIAKNTHTPPPSVPLRGRFPARNLERAQIFVVDEEAYLNGKLKPIAGAKINFVHPDFKINLKDPQSGEDVPAITNKAGLFIVPETIAESTRFFVEAPGYVPALGYATLGEVAVAVMYSEKRVSTLVKSLQLVVNPSTLMLFTRMIDARYVGVENLQLETPNSKSEVVYSGPFLGGIPGYFSHEFKNTDSTGSVILNNMQRNLQSIRNYSSSSQYAGHQVDLSGVPENIKFLSLTLQSGRFENMLSSVVDGDTFERPSCGIRTRMSNKQDPFIPNEEGDLWVEGITRPSVFDLNLSVCDDYVPTFLSGVTHPLLSAPTIGLFTPATLNKVLSPLHMNWSPNDSLVLGHVYPAGPSEKDGPIMDSVTLKIFDSRGVLASNAEIYYFDHDNKLAIDQSGTDPHHQNFLVLGLEDGEWHFVYADSKTGLDIGIQVVRVQKRGVTQVDFGFTKTKEELL